MPAVTRSRAQPCGSRPRADPVEPPRPSYGEGGDVVLTGVVARGLDDGAECLVQRHVPEHRHQLQQPQLSLVDVLVAAGAKASVVFLADNPGLWALHSLVAERADGGLIASFSVEE